MEPSGVKSHEDVDLSVDVWCGRGGHDLGDRRFAATTHDAGPVALGAQVEAMEPDKIALHSICRCTTTSKVNLVPRPLLNLRIVKRDRLVRQCDEDDTT